MQSNRRNCIPVMYKNEPLSPTSSKRAYYLVNIKKVGMFVYDKHLNIWYLKLKVRPSNFYKPNKFSLGIDTGSMYSGFSILNEHTNLNFEFEHTRIVKDKNFIKKKTESRKGARRLRRSRLRFRNCKFKNRSSNKITYTSNFYFQNYKNMVDWITNLFPITHIIVEDVKFDHFHSNKGKSFSNIEIGKTRLYEYLRTKGDLIISNKNPKKLRLNYFYKVIHVTDYSELIEIEDDDFRVPIKSYPEWDEYIDLKNEDKSIRNFWSHCIDSFSLANSIFDSNLTYSKHLMYIERRLPNIDQNRRILEKLQKVKNTKLRSYPKLTKIRLKPDNLTKSNHIKNWIYKYQFGNLILDSYDDYLNLSKAEKDAQRTYSKEKRKYGSSLCNSYQHGQIKGTNKYKDYQLGMYKYYSSKVY